jgi:hypothetical protein
MANEEPFDFEAEKAKLKKMTDTELRETDARIRNWQSCTL